MSQTTWYDLNKIKVDSTTFSKWHFHLNFWVKGFPNIDKSVVLS